MRLFRNDWKLLSPEPEITGGEGRGPQPQDPADIEPDDAGGEQEPPQRGTREERRAARGRQFRETREQAAQAEDLKRRNDELQRNIERLNEIVARGGQVQPPAPPQPPPPPAQDPQNFISPEVQLIMNAQTRLQREYNGLPEEERARRFEEFNSQFQQLDVARQTRIALEVQQADASRRQPAPAADPQAIRMELIKMRYADIFGSVDRVTGKRGQELFAAAIAYRVNMLGESNQSEATLDAAAADVRERLGLSGAQPMPPNDDRSRFTAPRTANNPAPAPTKSNNVQIPWDTKLKKMALAAYNEPKFDNLTDEQKLQRWANGPGRRAVLAMRRGG